MYALLFLCALLACGSATPVPPTLWAYCAVGFQAGPLYNATGHIRNVTSNAAASTTPSAAFLNNPAGSWTAAPATYLQLELDSQMVITGISTQGNASGYVAFYTLEYSVDGTSFALYGQNKSANTGGLFLNTTVNRLVAIPHRVQAQNLPGTTILGAIAPGMARIVRITPTVVVGSGSLRFELYTPCMQQATP